MNKLAGMIVLIAAALGLGFLATQANNDGSLEKNVQPQFQRSSEFSLQDVRQCLMSGNGSHIFEDYEGLATRRGQDPTVFDYLHENGSRLRIERSGEHAEVTLSSSFPPSSQELDLLQWCVARPQTTWIAPEYRTAQ